MEIRAIGGFAGDLDQFMESYLRWRRAQEGAVPNVGELGKIRVPAAEIDDQRKPLVRHLPLIVQRRRDRLFDQKRGTSAGREGGW